MVNRSIRPTSSLGSIGRLCFADRVVESDENTVPHVEFGFIKCKINRFRDLRLERSLPVAELVPVSKFST